MYGPTGRVLASGPAPCDEPKPKFDDDCDPVTYWGQGSKYYESIVFDFQLAGVVDVDAYDDEFPFTMIMLEKPYVGVLQTDFACKMLRNRLIRRVWKSMQDPTSRLYQVGLIPSFFRQW